MAGVLLFAVACNDKGMAGPLDETSPGTLFPDSITVAMALPPVATAPSGTPIDFNAGSDLTPLQVHARATVESEGPRVLRVIVSVLNPTSANINVSHGYCWLDLGAALYKPNSTIPVWRSEFARDPRYPDPSCILSQAVRTIAARDSIAFDIAYPMYVVTGDTLPAGPYSVHGRVMLVSFRPPRVEMAYDSYANDVEITRDRDRLPLARTVNGLRYVATTRVVQGSGGPFLRALVLVTNTSSSRRYSSYNGTCPISLGVYRSALARDSVPSLPSEGTLVAGCDDNALRNFALEPGQSWVFGNDIPLGSLTGRFSPGHYWFTAGFGGVALSAGDLDTRS
jgi:hypothetical protein